MLAPTDRQGSDRAMTIASTAPARRRTLSWRSLVRLAVTVDLLLLLAQGVAHKDREALAVAAAMLLGAGLLRLRSGLAGLLLLCLAFANLALWMLPAAISNAGHRQGLVGILLPAVLTASSLAGLIGGLVAVARRSETGASAAAVRRAGLGAVAAVAVALVVAAVIGPGPGETARASELAVDFSNTAFHPVALTAPSGQVSILLSNRDLFWHTFTIDRPAVNVDVPVGGARRVTFSLPPGTYQFYCRIPGHKQAGMVGTLTVR
jgi:plastocyanin